jgi:leucyl aminopeptidase (aminopeptidase T)
MPDRPPEDFGYSLSKRYARCDVVATLAGCRPEEDTMKTFMAVYTGSADAIGKWSAMPEQELRERQAAGVKAWHAWVERHKESIVETGAPLGRTKRVTTAGIADTRNNLTAYTVVRAESHEAAARLFEQHPHFTIFPGDGVEIMECLPIPGA